MEKTEAQEIKTENTELEVEKKTEEIAEAKPEEISEGSAEKEPDSKEPDKKPVKIPALPKVKMPKPSELIRRLKRLSVKNGILIILVELILLLFLAVILSQHISLNSGDDVLYSDYIDKISCSDGQLSVNSVSVRVPTDNVSYSISYDWGKDDKDYPTVPKVAIASYQAEGGDLKYDISLYRESLTPAKKVPDGKDASNWFSDWKTVSDDNSHQEPKQSGDINGFLVSTVGSDPEGAYETTSFYFAVPTKEGVSVYVAEGLLYDKTAEEEFNKVMTDVIASVKTKKQAA